jgi:hypothetical protein
MASEFTVPWQYSQREQLFFLNFLLCVSCANLVSWVAKLYTYSKFYLNLNLQLLKVCFICSIVSLHYTSIILDLNLCLS